MSEIFKTGGIVTAINRVVEKLDSLVWGKTQLCTQTIKPVPTSILMVNNTLLCRYVGDQGDEIQFSAGCSGDYARGSFKVPDNYVAGDISICALISSAAQETITPLVFYSSKKVGDAVGWEYSNQSGQSQVINTTLTKLTIYTIPAANFQAGDEILYAFLVDNGGNTNTMKAVHFWIEYLGNRP